MTHVITRPTFRINSGTKRTRELLQIPGTGRGGQSDGSISWYFTVPVEATTPNFTWQLTAFKAAQLWDLATQAGDPSEIYLDIQNDAYVVFCLDNTDQLYAIRQDHFASVQSISDLCPIAWVDVHLDLTTRTPDTKRVIFFYALHDGFADLISHASAFNYGISPTGAVAYPSVSGSAPGLNSTHTTLLAGNRLAVLTGAAMVALGTGQLAYLPNAVDPASAVPVSLPQFTATDVTPRIVGINANPDTTTWWALVEYDPGASTHYGMVVLSSTVQDATDVGDWDLAYTIFDMTTAPSGAGGLAATSAVTTAVPTPLSPVSGSFIFDQSAGGFSTEFTKLHCLYDAASVFAGIQVAASISVFFADGTPGSYAPQAVLYSGTMVSGTYYLSAHPTGGLKFDNSVPPGAVALLTVTVTDRPDLVYRIQQGATRSFVDMPSVSNPQTIPHPTSMSVTGIFSASPSTHNGTFIIDPALPSALHNVWTSDQPGVRTDDVSMSTSADTTNPLCYLQLQINYSINTSSSGTFGFNKETLTLTGSTGYAGDGGLGNPSTYLQVPTNSGYTGFNYAQSLDLLLNSGPTIEALASIGGATPVVRAFGIGTNGETMVDPGTGTWSIWHYVVTTVVQTATTLSGIPSGILFARALFGAGSPSPLAIDGSLVDVSGSVDPAPVAIACFNENDTNYYALFTDGTLRMRAGPFGFSWTVLVSAHDMGIAPPFMPFIIHANADNSITCVFGQGTAITMGTYDPVAGTFTVNTDAAMTFTTYGVANTDSTFSVGALLT